MVETADAASLLTSSFDQTILASTHRMATDFDTLLAERTKKGLANVHGVMIKCVDKKGL